jgi:hypothetical protein
MKLNETLSIINTELLQIAENDRKQNEKLGEHDHTLAGHHIQISH